MNWEKYKQYYDNMSEIEKSLLTRRFNEYMEICSEWSETNRPEVDARFELFKIGWIMACIESD